MIDTFGQFLPVAKVHSQVADNGALSLLANLSETSLFRSAVLMLSTNES